MGYWRCKRSRALHDLAVTWNAREANHPIDLHEAHDPHHVIEDRPVSHSPDLEGGHVIEKIFARDVLDQLAGQTLLKQLEHVPADRQGAGGAEALDLIEILDDGTRQRDGNCGRRISDAHLLE